MPKKAEASDPRNRLPPSQLGSPYLQGGQVRARSIFPRLRFGNSCLSGVGPCLSRQQSANQNDVLAPEEPNVYRPRGQPLFGAPAERKVRIDEYDEPYISLRWSELPFRMEESITFGPSGTQRFGRVPARLRFTSKAAIMVAAQL